MNLHLKYRPQTFEEVYGNRDTVEALQNTVQRDDRPHSMLMHGPTGCGKTTLARIVARGLGCNGRDFREVDSADFRGIDTIREMRKQAQFKPLEGPCRVWLLDECHKLSNDAQNALLKALEDTPQHVYYILATTEPHKLIQTIRGRCSQYQVAPLEDKQMMRLLRHVVKQEGERLEKKVYEQVAESSEGRPRNALQILNQVLAVDEGRREEVAKRSEERMAQSIELCRALVQGAGWKKVANLLGALKTEGEEPETLRRTILGYCSSVLLKEENHQVAGVMEEFLVPFYDTGWPGLVFACYRAVNA